MNTEEREEMGKRLKVILVDLQTKQAHKEQLCLELKMLDTEKRMIQRTLNPRVDRRPTISKLSNEKRGVYRQLSKEDLTGEERRLLEENYLTLQARIAHEELGTIRDKLIKVS